MDLILDAAGQKGTGKWTVLAALDEGQPLTLIGEAVFARCLSAIKEERVAASKVLKGKMKKIRGDRQKLIADLRQALYAAKIVSYAQGFQLMRSAAKTYSWNLNYGGIALMWRGGCIIRSAFLGKIKEAYVNNPEADQPAARPVLRRRGERRRRSPWRNVIDEGRAGAHPGPGDRFGAGVLRRLPRPAASGEPAPGAARLLRRAHLRARGQAARRVLPHELDRQRRNDERFDVHGITEYG